MSMFTNFHVEPFELVFKLNIKPSFLSFITSEQTISVSPPRTLYQNSILHVELACGNSTEYNFPGLISSELIYSIFK